MGKILKKKKQPTKNQFTLVVKFDSPKQWILNGEKIEITKLEVRSYKLLNITDKLPRPIVSVLNPLAVRKRVLKNVALLPNGSFHEKDRDTVIARIHDVNGKTLIRTDWEIDMETFNYMVISLLYNSPDMDENSFHIHARLS